MFDIPLAQRLWFPSATRTRLAETCQRSVWYYSHTDFWLGKNFNFNGVGRISADRTSSIQQNMSLYVQHMIIKPVKDLWDPTEETVDNTRIPFFNTHDLWVGSNSSRLSVKIAWVTKRQLKAVKMMSSCRITWMERRFQEKHITN